MEVGDPQRQVDHLTVALGVCTGVPNRGWNLTLVPLGCGVMYQLGLICK